MGASTDIASPHAGRCAFARSRSPYLSHNWKERRCRVAASYGLSVLQAFFVLRHYRLAVINWMVDPRAGLKFIELQQLCGTKRGLLIIFRHTSPVRIRQIKMSRRTLKEGKPYRHRHLLTRRFYNKNAIGGFGQAVDLNQRWAGEFACIRRQAPGGTNAHPLPKFCKLIAISFESGRLRA